MNTRSAQRRVAARQPSLSDLDVAYVVHQYPKVSHVFILREVRALRDAGARVDTYSLRRAGSDDLLTAADGVEARTTTSLRPVSAFALAAAHVRSFLRAPRDYLATARFALSVAPPGPRALVWQVLYFGQAVVLAERLRRRSARHVHAHLANVATDVVWLSVDLLRRTGDAWTWSFTMHGPTEFHDVRAFNLARKAEAADLVVCISDFCRSQLMALTPPEVWARMQIAHCGIDGDELSFTDRTARAPHHLLSVGRLVPEKAHALLLEAVADVRRRGHDLTVTIVGDGPERERLLALRTALGLEGALELPGALGQDDLVTEFDRADAFVLSSFDEGVPVVLMEAMARGVPVVATMIAGIPELIDDGIDGILVPPGRADLLADATCALFDDATLRERLTAHARAKVVRDFDISTEARKLGVHLLACRARPAERS